MTKTKSGFTIVELLIVIVVIAILAAITIVAYNGIQARAKMTAQTADMNKIGKAMQLWSAESGKSLLESGVGASGLGHGSFSTSYSGLPSVETLLRDSGYLKGDYPTLTAILVGKCSTNAGDNRWFINAIVQNPPSTTSDEQRIAAGCDYGTAVAYTSSPYTSRNFFKVY